MKKPYKHICKNCYYYSEEDKVCLNCDSPSDIRKKEPENVCDGGGKGAENFGFVPIGYYCEQGKNLGCDNTAKTPFQRENRAKETGGNKISL